MPTRGPRLSVERALAVLGLLGLFLVAGISASMIAGAAGGEEEVAPSAASSAGSDPTPTATPTPTPAATPVALTPEERLQRSAAARLVRQQGFDPVSLKVYHPDQTLRVLLADTSATSRANGVPDGRRAFFFVGDAFIESDTPEPTTKLRILRQTENTVTLGYGLTGGREARVRFRWDGTGLAPQGPIPPAPERLQ